MAVKKREELLSAISELVGDAPDDKGLTIIEDFSDTMDELEKGGGEWENKYNELDKSWRKKYKERFLNGAKVKEEQEEQINEDNDNPRSYNELFEEREG